MRDSNKMISTIIAICVVIVSLGGGNSKFLFIGCSVFLIAIIIERIIGYKKRNKILQSIHINTNDEIKFREVHSIVDIIGMLPLLSYVNNSDSIKEYSYILKDEFSIKGIDKFINMMNTDEKIIILVFVSMVILSIYLIIEGFIKLARFTNEGILFRNGLNINYENIEELEYNKNLFSIFNKNRVIKITYNKGKSIKEIIVKESELKNIMSYLEMKTGIKVEYAN